MVTRKMFREKRFLAIVFSPLLLLTGCSSSTVSQEQTVKLLEYEKCLEFQQGLNNQINKSLSELFAKNFDEILTILSNQGELDETGKLKRFEVILKNCLPYRP